MSEPVYLARVLEAARVRVALVGAGRIGQLHGRLLAATGRG